MLRSGGDVEHQFVESAGVGFEVAGGRHDRRVPHQFLRFDKVVSGAS